MKSNEEINKNKKEKSWKESERETDGTEMHDRENSKKKGIVDKKQRRTREDKKQRHKAHKRR